MKTSVALVFIMWLYTGAALCHECDSSIDNWWLANQIKGAYHHILFLNAALVKSTKAVWLLYYMFYLSVIISLSANN